MILVLFFLTAGSILSMTMMKTSTMFEREELVQPIFNFLVGALSMVGCFYFLFIASTLLFRWEGFIVGPADAMTIGEGHVPLH